jgi:hypothetical protein
MFIAFRRFGIFFAHKSANVNFNIRRLKIMADGDGGSGAGSAMWAVVTLLIVLIVVGALYFGGAFGNRSAGPTKVDVKIDAPAPSR